MSNRAAPVWEPTFDGERWCVVWEASDRTPWITEFTDEHTARRFCAAVTRFLAYEPERLLLVEGALKRGVDAGKIADLIESIETQPTHVEVKP